MIGGVVVGFTVQGDDVVVGIGGGGKDFLAIDHPAIAIAIGNGQGTHITGVGTGVGLGHRNRHANLALNELWQVVLFLSFAAIV